MKAPWEDRGRELEPKHGPYCFYAAWEEWVAANDNGDTLGDLDAIEKSFLFALFEKAVEQAKG